MADNPESLRGAPVASPATSPVMPPVMPPVLLVREAASFLARARGLLGGPPPAPGCALLLRGVCVHGFGMRYPIDLVFLDDEGVVVRCAELPPARIRACIHARHVLEMRTGEGARLGLRPGVRPLLVPATDIFSSPPAGRGIAVQSRIPDPVSGPDRSKRMTLLFFSFLGAMLLSPPLAAQPTATVASSPVLPSPLVLARPLAARTLHRLEEEAEARYREARRPDDAASLIRLYESLAELGPDHTWLAWLRIGNLHQRTGSIGAAIDAYRRILLAAPPDQRANAAAGKASSADDAAAATAERKALFNLAILSLDQARQSLARLALLQPSPAGRARDTAVLSGRADSPGSEHAAGGLGDPLAAQAHRHLLDLEQSLTRYAGWRHDPVAGDRNSPLDPGPLIVQHRTSQARPSPGHSAGGDLQLHPDAEAIARPGAAARPRPVDEALPSVEYLLGDPDRHKQRSAAAEKRAVSRRARVPERAPDGTRRAGPTGDAR